MSIELQDLESTIDKAWEMRDNLAQVQGVNAAVTNLLKRLDSGDIRVCEMKDGKWIVHQWIKKGILLSFRLFSNKEIFGAPGIHESHRYWFDKVALKFDGFTEKEFQDLQIRAVPGSIVRHSAYIGPNVILMPSFVNVGAWVGPGTLIDTWATIGSCAQIGANCHISGGAGIGGVLEPLQANPVIIEDGCFIGARSEIVEGVIVGKGAVIGMGVFIGSSTKIVDRHTGEVSYGLVPPYSVVVSGSYLADKPHLPSLNCAVIIKKVDERTRQKTSLNELLRF
ncbi:MAG: 2,3,4,5-tetrahydropyridine-2,6-dicarboxylate N-succinyltransferase [Alphaproteobacteria bacterium]|nr:2,3,4,5-tetrahydropyridine-2,6-dicarboxylate N-succinyltransferase [Alphaproteobacteria bacterium]OJV45186.1 MAG: 2,3,4,5-tetrahydropyridine-2,6-dicarboxylate N-succinyltransferase [Alphaproteobacteria bacterium 43-37]